MSVSSQSASSPAPGAPRRGQHPAIALTIIAASQLMVVLDATIVNIALPHIQRALGFSTTDLSWVLNAYTLAFGGLLLLGGRMLTSWLSWRWVLFVNVPIGALLAAVAPQYLSESERQPGRFDLGGALTS